MKHSLRITLLLIGIFFLAQIMGIAILDQYINIKETFTTGKTVIYEEKYNLTGITPPPIENESTSYLYILAGVLLGTLLVLLIIRFKKKNLWKFWFFVSVVICLVVAWTPFIQKLLLKLSISEEFTVILTTIIASILAIYKIFKQNILIHNFTELFIYGGLAAILVPRINLFSVTILLIAISLYDMYAVWKSKHMVTMATFQSDAKMFAGVLIPYNTQALHAQTTSRTETTKTKEAQLQAPQKQKTADVSIHAAVLGGGDIAFPLLFSGVIMKTTGSYLNPIIISVVVTVALFILLLAGKRGKFYPAMPFLAIGCLGGYGIISLL